MSILNNLKVAHDKFTWSGKEIPHIERYSGLSWNTFWLRELDARAEFPLSTGEGQEKTGERPIESTTVIIMLCDKINQ